MACFLLQVGREMKIMLYPDCLCEWIERSSRRVFLNRRTTARYRALTSIIHDRKIFSWN